MSQRLEVEEMLRLFDVSRLVVVRRVVWVEWCGWCGVGGVVVWGACQNTRVSTQLQLDYKTTVEDGDTNR